MLFHRARQTVREIAGSALRFRLLGAFTYESLAKFDCRADAGDRHAELINSWVHDAVWMKWQRTSAFEFLLPDDSAAAYLLVQRFPFRHPTHTSRRKRDYLYLAGLGVRADLQGVQDPTGTETYAEGIMRAIEVSIVGNTDPRLAGAFLLTAEDNGKAIGLATKAGYVQDEAGPFTDTEDGEARLVFRKPTSDFRNLR